jgi:outer membrane receptor for ferrienterochelin and colicins
MHRILIIFFCASACLSAVYAQKNDSISLSEDIDEIVVTATKSEAVANDLPLPISLINKKSIQAMGALRLDELLREQTGLFVQSEHGKGIQMQGFDADYTLILVDGEPIIGRTAGTLELSRIAVANVERVEILKGASSSLYGSEALAGVINIITDKVRRNRIDFSARYGNNQTLDLGVQAQWQYKKWTTSIFFNRYSSSGYDLSPAYGQTVEPFSNYTTQFKIAYAFAPKGRVEASLRYFDEAQTAKYDIGSSQTPIYISGDGRIKDLNLTSTLYYDWSAKWSSQLRFYRADYTTKSNLYYERDDSLYDADFFNQRFTRLELQSNYKPNEKNKFVFGLGQIWESVAATRYVDRKYFSSNYIFGQYEAQFCKKINLIAGGRFDHHTVYGAQFSPKLALGYRINNKISLRTSLGWGFKAPDFRQLYLNFNNTVAGYSVFGSEELPQAIRQLQASNQLAALFVHPDSIGKLQAERSIGYNLGANFNINKQLKAQVNFFRNDVRNLIETQTAARQTNGQTIFSYYNINRIFTQGIEINAQATFAKYFDASAGYQLLFAKDKSILTQIRAGEIYRRDAQTLETQRVALADYGGLFQRSRHSYNLKLGFALPKKGFSTTLRAIYRGRYGFADTNANAILDHDSEYVKGYFTLHLSATKYFWHERIRIQAGADNLLNYRQSTQMPNLFGRLYWLSLQFSLHQ